LLFVNRVNLKSNTNQALRLKARHQAMASRVFSPVPGWLLARRRPHAVMTSNLCMIRIVYAKKLEISIRSRLFRSFLTVKTIQPMLWAAAPCDGGINERSAVGWPPARSITLARLLTRAFCFERSIPTTAKHNVTRKRKESVDHYLYWTGQWH
jgi:hypothetical protein